MWTLIAYTLYAFIEFKRRTVGGQGMGNQAISAHSVHPIVRAQAPLRLTLGIWLLSFIPLQVPLQVCMRTRHWSKFLALFRVPIRCRHTGLLATFLQY